MNKESNWSKFNPEAKSLSYYCLIISILFVLISNYVYIPLSQMMITFTRKYLGGSFLIFSILFFIIFSLKTSKSIIFLIPLIIGIIFCFFPFLLIIQEPRYGYNWIKSIKEFEKNCNFIDNSIKFPKKDLNKFLIFQPTNTGTGNRILGLISSYLLSLITGRQFLLDWKLTTVFNAKFNDLFNSNKINDSFDSTNISLNEFDFLDLTVCRHCSIRFYHKDFYYITLNDLNEQYNKKYLIIQSNSYFIPSLLSNKNYRSMICNHFNSDTVFNELFHNVLNFSTEILNLYEIFSEQFSSQNVIGIQIRTKDRVGFPEDRIHHFINCAENLLYKYNNSKIFIATDNNEIKKLIKNFFKEKVILLNYPTREFNLKGIQYALLDILLLSKCKELILTPYSTFGSVAAGIGNIIPHYITRDEGYCIKDIKSEPKPHYWHTLFHYNLKEITSSYSLNFDESFF